MKKWFTVCDGAEYILGTVMVANLEKNAQGKFHIQADPTVVEHEVMLGILIEEKAGFAPVNPTSPVVSPL